METLPFGTDLPAASGGLRARKPLPLGSRSPRAGASWWPDASESCLAVLQLIAVFSPVGGCGRLLWPLSKCECLLLPGERG